MSGRALATQKREALRSCARIKTKQTREKQAKEAATRNRSSARRPLERIRTYNFPQGRSPTRIGLTLYKINDIMDVLSQLTQAFARRTTGEQLAAFAEER